MLLFHSTPERQSIIVEQKNSNFAKSCTATCDDTTKQALCRDRLHRVVSSLKHDGPSAKDSVSIIGSSA